MNNGKEDWFSVAYTQEQLGMWNRVVDSFRNGGIAMVSFNEWIKPMQLFAVTSDEVIVTSPKLQMMGALRGRYQSQMEAVVRSVFGMSYRLTLLDPREVPSTRPDETMLNPKYQFDNFVVGAANNFAYAASLAVAEQPSDVYNPLFIYGDVGLGKTHLMNAIGNFIMRENPMANILLTTSERFTNELIDAIVKKRGTAELRAKMRNVDVLMVDDIQFLSKTTATQEEFFHTFNELYNNHKQIIISSDRPPKEIPTIEERLRSRFEWGLIVDIQKPDFETRVAILRRKADEEHIEIPYDAVEYIAAHFDKSIRDLEGALTRVAARSRLMNDSITLESAMETLSTLVSTPDTRKITPELIMDVIARKFDLTVDDLLSSKRNREIAGPRQIGIYLCREMTELSTTNIGRAFGNRDHTTVLHSCEKIADQIKNDLSFKKKVDELIAMVKNS